MLRALAERRLGDLPRVMPPPEAQWEQRARELAAAFGHLCAVHASYWDRDWHREHRGLGRYPEHHLWAAVQGYMDLYDAAEPTD